MTIESAEEFVELRQENDERAAHDDASLAVWHAIIDRYPDMDFWVAYNKTVPVEILERLASSPDARVRVMVARKRKATPALLSRLATDEHDAVRAAVARHRSTPREVLEAMLEDDWAEVRSIVRERLES